MPKPEKTTKKQRGRPTRHAGGKLSKNRTFKIYPDLDAKLIAAAAKTGRTVSEEIERRLDRSFASDEALGSPSATALFHLIAATAAQAKHDPNGFGDEKQPLADAVVAATARVLANLLPDILWVKIGRGDDIWDPDSVTTVYAREVADVEIDGMKLKVQHTLGFKDRGVDDDMADRIRRGRPIALSGHEPDALVIIKPAPADPTQRPAPLTPKEIDEWKREYLRTHPTLENEK